ncbi:FAD-dependent oxidoreductase [Cohnella rhizosphaerae]|uniref:FAD-dependent oxidoreductase n=1 Tax=Cohnella rhizosphaerae TaxID=1457232 RepID=UPI0030B87D8B
MAKTMPWKNGTLDIAHETDVLVVGGGPAGVAAAIAAASNGARTLLLEQRGYLGGMATVSLVPAFCPFTDKEKPVVRGIGLALMEEMKRRCSESYLAMHRDRLDWVPIDAETLKVVYDEAVLGSGADVLFHSFVVDALLGEVGQSVRGVAVANKTGLSAIACRYVIDATGDADIAARAGAPFQKGGEQGGAAAGYDVLSAQRRRQAPIRRLPRGERR